MLKKLALLGSLAILVLCNTVNAQTTQSGDMLQYSLDQLKTLVIKGDFNLQLIPSNAPAKLVLSNTAVQQQYHLTPRFANNTLYLEADETSSPIQATLYCGPLAHINYTGKQRTGSLTGTLINTSVGLQLQNLKQVNLNGSHVQLQELVVRHINNVELSGIQAANLNVISDDVGNISLDGIINMQQLTQTGTGTFSAMWVNSSRLNINTSGNAKIYLAGKVDFLNATATQTSQINAQYLRVQKAFVKTEDNSQALIAVLDSMNAFADNNSNIYYYETPTFLNRYTRANGTIIFMRNPPLFCSHSVCKRLPDMPG